MSRGLAFSLADGHFLAATSRTGSWAPPAVLLTGLVAGAGTIGYERVPTEALWIVLTACAAGFLATHLGLVFVAGLATGDFLLGQRVWFASRLGGLLDEGLLAGLVRIRLPMLIGYALLAALAVYLPRLARSLLADLPRADRLPWQGAFAVAGVLNIVVVAVGARLWAEATAVLVRPLFTWRGARPAAEAVVTLQEQGGWVVLAAVAATIVRFAVLLWAHADTGRAGRVRAAEEALAGRDGRTPAVERAGPVTRSVAAAAGTTLILAGVIEAWWVAGVTFAVFLVLRLVRHGVIPPRLQRWRHVAARVPVLLRLAVALVVVDTLRRLFVDESAATFTPLALYVTGAVVVLYLLLPGPPAGSPARTGARA